MRRCSWCILLCMRYIYLHILKKKRRKEIVTENNTGGGSICVGWLLRAHHYTYVCKWHTSSSTHENVLYCVFLIFWEAKKKPGLVCGECDGNRAKQQVPSKQLLNLLTYNEFVLLAVGYWRESARLCASLWARVSPCSCAYLYVGICGKWLDFWWKCAVWMDAVVALRSCTCVKVSDAEICPHWAPTERLAIPSIDCSSFFFILSSSPFRNGEDNIFYGHEGNICSDKFRFFSFLL